LAEALKKRCQSHLLIGRRISTTALDQ